MCEFCYLKFYVTLIVRLIGIVHFKFLSGSNICIYYFHMSYLFHHIPFNIISRQNVVQILTFIYVSLFFIIHILTLTSNFQLLCVCFRYIDVYLCFIVFLQFVHSLKLHFFRLLPNASKHFFSCQG